MENGDGLGREDSVLFDPFLRVSRGVARGSLFAKLDFCYQSIRLLVRLLSIDLGKCVSRAGLSKKLTFRSFIKCFL